MEHEIEAIRKDVAKISNDPDIRVYHADLQEFTVTSETPPEFRYFSVYYNKEGIQRIRISHHGGHFTLMSNADYYLHNRQSIYIYQEYTEMSRMGSCGQIRIKHELFFRDGQFIKSISREEPYVCYHHTPETEGLLFMLDQVLSMIDGYIRINTY